MQRSTRQEIGVYFIDKGYVSQPLFDSLLERGLHLLTRLKKNMKNKRMPLVDKLLLYKRGIIESVDDQLKNISQTEHTRHRSSGILQPIS
ncbi:transposase [Candidatus Glomeribacter gigasporarum]|uniref:transposase n=1 Tax=Candidatus Glomeribacter gigasporarum TaxID=132144 RepID=UPI0030B972F5